MFCHAEERPVPILSGSLPFAQVKMKDYYFRNYLKTPACSVMLRNEASLSLR